MPPFVNVLEPPFCVVDYYRCSYNSARRDLCRSFFSCCVPLMFPALLSVCYVLSFLWLVHHDTPDAFTFSTKTSQMKLRVQQGDNLLICPTSLKYYPFMMPEEVRNVSYGGDVVVKRTSRETSAKEFAQKRYLLAFSTTAFWRCFDQFPYIICPSLCHLQGHQNHLLEVHHPCQP